MTKLVCARRFSTAEKRLEKFHKLSATELAPIPDDGAIADHIKSCILTEQEGNPICLPNMSDSLTSEMAGNAFAYSAERDCCSLEKEWPLGPTSSIGPVWPFIFVSSDYESAPPAQGGRYLICAVVALFHNQPRMHALELPELTAAFGVLEHLMDFLPPPGAVSPSAVVVSRVQYLLKSALPFGSPVEMSVDVLNQLESTSMAINDAAILEQTPAMSAQRLPGWKPFPLYHTNLNACLKLRVIELVSFEVMNGDLRRLSVSGRIFCDTDLPGSPEVIIPVDAPTRPSVSLHDCAKFATDSPRDERIKISCIPLSHAFELCSFSLSQSSLFPLDLSFRLFQISPQHFKFSLTAKLRIQFSQFSVLFSVNDRLRISQLPSLQQSARTKTDVTNQTHVLWTFKNPGTFSADGESIDGVIETDRPLAAGEEISRSAAIQFRIADNYFSRLKIDKESISVFPTVSKAYASASYETVSSGGCSLLNSATDNAPPALIDFTDCIDLPQEAYHLD